VYIKPKNSTAMLPIDYKIDTGANCTTIGNDFLYELGYDSDWIKTGQLLTNPERPVIKLLTGHFRVVA
jgi:hypothetical protein